MSTVESNIASITKDILAGVSAAEGGRTSYLRALVSATIESLGASLRVNAVKVAKTDEPTMKAQLAALEGTHEKFYAIVTKTAGEHLKGVELNRATNFARTALYAVRIWVRAHNDITCLAPRKVSKPMLAVVGRKLVRKVSVQRLKTRAEKQSKALVSALLALGEADVKTAALELETLMEQLTDQLGAITGTTEKAIKKFQHSKTQILTRAQVAQALGAP
jgi:hypothetical protein